MAEFRAGEDDANRRLDRILRKMYPSVSLGHIYKLIRRGAVRVNEHRAKPSTRIRAGDAIRVSGVKPSPPNTSEAPTANDGQATTEQQLSTEKSSTDWSKRPHRLSIRRMRLLENNDVLVLNKPRGALVHGRGSLNNLVKAYLEPGRPPSLSFTPGPVHRIDRNTSGILIFGKTLKASRLLSRFFKEGLVAKFYIALLDGRVERPITWKDRLRRNYRTKTTVAGGRIGREAITDVWPVIADEISLVVMRIHTGITHQIRTQASFHGHPLTGDTKYGGSPLIPGYLLHAGCIHLKAEEAMGFTTVFAPPPTDFVTCVATLLGEDALAQAEESIRERILEAKRSNH